MKNLARTTATSALPSMLDGDSTGERATLRTFETTERSVQLRVVARPAARGRRIVVGFQPNEEAG